MVILLILQLCYLLPLDRRYWRTCIGIKDNEPERNICFISELLFFSPCFRSHTRDTGCFFVFIFALHVSFLLHNIPPRLPVFLDMRHASRFA